MAALDDLQHILRYPFVKPALLRRALVHPSYAHEKSCQNNQRLEFLGDAVLGMAIAEELYRRFPKKNEGDLSRLRALLVSRKALAEMAHQKELGQFLKVGRGEYKIHVRDSVLADLLEAIVGAVFLDGGYDAARKVVRHLFGKQLRDKSLDVVVHNFKGHLQELAQKKFGHIPQYRVVQEEGRDHERHFVVEVVVGKNISAQGAGKSKKEAQQMAAKNILKLL